LEPEALKLHKVAIRCLALSLQVEVVERKICRMAAAKETALLGVLAAALIGQMM
jgi:hypothetical protein